MDGPSLPSIEEILASTQILSAPDSITTVVKVRERFAVKYGRLVAKVEAENLVLLANTDVPAPRRHGFIADPETNRSFLIMEFIEGDNLEQILPSLNLVERNIVFKQVQDALTCLRNLEPPDYIGSVSRKPLNDGIFYTEPVDPKQSGPFANQEEMNKGMLLRLSETCVPSHVQFLRSLIESTLQGHKTVFTHADLQLKNIMVHRVGSKEDGSAGVFEVKIIDWEMSGWYPEYWEFCNATVWDGLKPDWLDAVQEMMVGYSKEYLMLKLIRSIVFQLG
ncbi:hypothetical protein M409DRAFT_22947 [Zasmidium cellare ATCC 36951]|uniref:Aminoglycoside phosphotransferase domain-containing protein n=1 Tax=Zasmidium cellare ATCC 36951 TaxID=1080233 RepID=A0A6A6CIC1_ZASCE|nr:uncharacterized protein M409DRAFT_22947 [Zasmidium cellare ATCC 36951]KAF2166895.1 hypothetical protein M409DRAFT_22947 [Zasmidium cellare ATCC 36951]